MVRSPDFFGEAIMNIKPVETKPFDDQKPGTAGLRATVKTYKQPNYLENFIQSLFDALSGFEGETLVLGGDGRYFSETAIPAILKMAAANGFGRVLIGRDGLLSTPNVSLTIRKYKAFGGVILTASHNPGGPDGDFGVKYSMSNGSLATPVVTDAIYDRTKVIDRYKILNAPDPDVSQIGTFMLGDMTVEVIDTVADYAELMESQFDFDAIRNLIASGSFTMRADSMSGVNGPYARKILVEMLGAPESTLVNDTPKPDFGGGHPDPNLTYAKEMVDFMSGPDACDYGVALDGDGARCMHLGRNFYVSPSDCLAVLAANAHLVPGYKRDLVGVARSMPTGSAVDMVAKKLGIPCYKTPTGWKYFGNLLDAGMITLCGEESFGCGSDHVREKDALWSVLFWLNILAVRRESVEQILRSHWAEFGRHYYARYDFEGVDKAAAEGLIENLRNKVGSLKGRSFGAYVVESADDFHYTDPVDNSESPNQGIRIMLEGGSRVLYRLSGTGTVGATLRVYAEYYEPNPEKHDLPPQEALSNLYELICEIGEVRERIERDGPDVIV